MRITTGKYKGRKLSAPPGDTIRPTSDRARQAVFNILSHGAPAKIFSSPIPQGMKVLDLCCGTGALALESLSRGAEYAMLVDLDIAIARDNARLAGAMGDCDFIAGDARQLPPSQQQYDLVFIDPPYYGGFIPDVLQQLRQKNWLASPALLVIETARDEDFSAPPPFELVEQRIYGAAKIGFYRFG